MTQLAQVVGVPVGRRSGGQLATTQVATISNIIFFSLFSPVTFFSVVYFSQRKSACCLFTLLHRKNILNSAKLFTTQFLQIVGFQLLHNFPFIFLVSVPYYHYYPYQAYFTCKIVSNQASQYIGVTLFTELSRNYGRQPVMEHKENNLK